MAKYVVASVDDIPPGDRKIVEVAGQSIGIFNLDGEFFALRNRCPHQGGPLCAGKRWGSLEASVPGEIRYGRPGEILACPWHGWEFDIRTGQSWCEPRRYRTAWYPVSVEPGAALVHAAAAAPLVGQMPADDAASEDQERVRGPYIAETFPVSTEGSYVVVEIAT